MAVNLAFEEPSWGNGDRLRRAPYTENFGSARAYRQQGFDEGPIFPGAAIADQGGTSSFYDSIINAHKMEKDMGLDLMDNAGSIVAARTLSAAQKAAANKSASAAKTGSVVSAVGGVGAAVAGALI